MIDYNDISIVESDKFGHVSLNFDVKDVLNVVIQMYIVISIELLD